MKSPALVPGVRVVTAMRCFLSPSALILYLSRDGSIPRSQISFLQVERNSFALIIARVGRAVYCLFDGGEMGWLHFQCIVLVEDWAKEATPLRETNV